MNFFKWLNKKRFFNRNLVSSQLFLAFTLAEVLITLGIIGIVAEMTIPDLVSQFQDNVNKTAYKKAFSTGSQAWMTAVNNNEVQNMSSWLDATNRVTNFFAFKKYFKVVVECNNTDTSNDISACWDRSGELYFLASPNTAAPAFIDSSGVAWSLCNNDLDNSVGSNFLVDTNGLKGPNKYGQDRFIMNPVAIDGTTVTNYFPIKFATRGDCLDTTSCTSYANVCPSVAKHPCYFTSWLYN